jgi:hypothetical protein
MSLTLDNSTAFRLAADNTDENCALFICIPLWPKRTFRLGWREGWCEDLHGRERAAWKGGCSQDWLPHNLDIYIVARYSESQHICVT